MTPSESFDDLLDHRDIVVCVGSGGVGKTTTSAVIGLQAALMGRKVLVLTIDPARRLANSLGVDRLGNEPKQIPLDQFHDIGLDAEGELWAMMLDMKQSFDRLVNKYAPSAEAKHRILRNKLYQYFSTSLAGTQEYAAAERLYELYTDGDYDLVVLDTPPTSHALDFLEAPTRLVDAINNRALQWLYKPSSFHSRSGFGLMSVGVNYVIKTLSRFTGSDLLDELGVFLEAFSTLFDGFNTRAQKVRELLTSDVTTFAVVTAPNLANIDEAIYFHDKLGEDEVRVGAFVVNRVHPSWVPLEELDRPSLQIADDLGDWHEAFSELTLEEKREFARKLRANSRDFQVLADLDQGSIGKLRDRVFDTVPILQVPYFSRDIHSLEGLDHVRRALFAQ